MDKRKVPWTEFPSMWSGHGGVLNHCGGNGRFLFLFLGRGRLGDMAMHVLRRLYRGNVFPGRTNYVRCCMQPALEIFCSQGLLGKRLAHPNPQCPGNLVLDTYLNGGILRGE